MDVDNENLIKRQLISDILFIQEPFMNVKTYIKVIDKNIQSLEFPHPHVVQTAPWKT